MHLDVCERFESLVGMELLCFYSDHVACYAIDGDDALLVGEELGRCRTVRHNPEEHPCPDEVDKPNDQEDELPCLDVRAVSVAQTVAKQSADHGGHAVEGEEDAHAKRLLRARVEHGHDVHDGGRDRSFEHAEEEAEGQHASVVFGGNVAAE